MALAAYVNLDHTDWDQHLSSAIFAINTARQSTTEVSPFEMVYGRLPNTVLENEFPWPELAPQPNGVFMERVNAMREAVKLRIVEKQQRTKQLVDSRRRAVKGDLHPGELVLVRHKLKKKGKTKKFLPKFTGPFQVVRKVCLTPYLVEDIPARRKKNCYRRFNAHVVQIRRYNVREDDEFCDVESDWEEDQAEESSNTDLPAGDPASSTPAESALEETPAQPARPVVTRRGRTVRPPKSHQDYVRH